MPIDEHNTSDRKCLKCIQSLLTCATCGATSVHDHSGKNVFKNALELRPVAETEARLSPLNNTGMNNS